MIGQLFALVAPYQPTLVGTFPLGLQLPGSDFDIACEALDLDAFEQHVTRELAQRGLPSGAFERLSMTPAATVLRLEAEDAHYEVFCQAQPVTRQAGFRHMVVEGRLIEVGGARLRDVVLTRKRQGQKTSRRSPRRSGSQVTPTQPSSSSSRRVGRAFTVWSRRATK